MGGFHEWHAILRQGFQRDINGLILIAFMLGLICHGRPIPYVRSFESGARTVGPILLDICLI